MRADKVQWLRPLAGKTLLCNCQTRDGSCHGMQLANLFATTFQASGSQLVTLDAQEGSEDEDDNVVRHMSRYKFAASFIPKGSRLLDCACGSGYGSELLAEKAGSVLGIDRCSDAIDYARAHFDAPNIEFRQGDIGHLKFAQDSFDAVVSLETLEHVPRDVCESYLRNIVQWLKPGGILVCSSPMLRYSNGKPYVTNPYHINELPRDELIQMLEQHNEHLQLNYFHQKEDAFQPLLDEHTGFCVIVARKRVEAVANKQPEEALAHTRIAG